MNEETIENDTLTNEPVTEEPTTPEAERPEEDKSKELQSALAQKDHFREKFEKSEADRKALEEQLNKRIKSTGQPQIDPIETVKLAKAVSDNTEEELEFIIRNAKDKTPQGIVEAKSDPWVKAAINGMREKAEKERQTLAPSTRQPESKKELSFTERLTGASLEEKEKMLTEQGLYKTYRRRPPSQTVNLSSNR